MQSPDELRRENEALRDRISKFSAAILRISVSLGVSTVLQQVAESEKRRRQLLRLRESLHAGVNRGSTNPALFLSGRPSTAEPSSLRPARPAAW